MQVKLTAEQLSTSTGVIPNGERDLLLLFSPACPDLSRLPRASRRSGREPRRGRPASKASAPGRGTACRARRDGFERVPCGGAGPRPGAFFIPILCRGAPLSRAQPRECCALFLCPCSGRRPWRASFFRLNVRARLQPCRNAPPNASVISNEAGRFFLPFHSSEASVCEERNLSSLHDRTRLPPLSSRA